MTAIPVNAGAAVAMPAPASSTRPSAATGARHAPMMPAISAMPAVPKVLVLNPRSAIMPPRTAAAAPVSAGGSGPESSAMARLPRPSGSSSASSRTTRASRAASGRAFGSGESPASMARDRRSGRSGRSVRMGATSPSAARRAVSAGLAPSRGFLPVSPSYSTSVAAHTSAAPVTTSPVACSGAMYAMVPTTPPVWVIPLSPESRATPRSVTRACPSSSTRMLAGLMSRWITPRSCACARASSTSAAISAAARSPGGVSAYTRSNDGPSISSEMR